MIISWVLGISRDEDSTTPWHNYLPCLLKADGQLKKTRPYKKNAQVLLDTRKSKQVWAAETRLPNDAIPRTAAFPLVQIIIRDGEDAWQINCTSSSGHQTKLFSQEASTAFLNPLFSLLFLGDAHFYILFSFLLLPLYPPAPGFSSSLLLNFLNPSTSEGGSRPVFLIYQKSLALTRKASKNTELFGSMHSITIELPACRVDLVLQFSVEIPSKR